MKRVLWLLAVVLLSACAGQQLAPEKRSAIKTVGSVSAIGDDVSLTHASPFGFNSYANGRIEGFNVDDVVLARARSIIADRYQVVPVAYDRAALSPGRGGPTNGPEAVADFIRNGVQPKNLDAYLVVTRGASGFGRVAISGLGLLRTPDILSSRYNVHAFYDLTIVDGRTYQVLLRRRASFPDSLLSLNAGLSLEGPYRQVDESWWAESFEALRAQQKNQLAEALDKLLADSLAVTLRDMKFVD
jgi:hypothetical protein